MTQIQVFLWGALCDPELRATVLGADLALTSAVLPDHSIRSNTGAGPDFLVPRQGEHVPGEYVSLNDTAHARLALLASITGAVACEVRVLVGAQPRDATLFAVPAPDGPLCDWDRRLWHDQLAPAMRLAVAEALSLATLHTPEVLRVRFPPLLAHAASQIRAGRENVPATLRRPAQNADVISRQRMQPYTYFFGVQVDDLQFRRFDGSLSPIVRRAGFVMADAVTILPYDPVRDCVLVIEQFRYGPFVRGVANPWLLEPVAGRIDPGENPEQAALREMAEETHLRIGADALVRIGTSYPSPGAITELLFNFVALCDLPDTLEGVTGLAAEAEDIRSHVIPLDRLLDMIPTNEAQNGPLIQSAYWLALNRARLREMRS
ncbi:MAG: NUDIX domain-containing protein [Roseinatronobacter sp.]